MYLLNQNTVFESRFHESGSMISLKSSFRSRIKEKVKLVFRTGSRSGKVNIKWLPNDILHTILSFLSLPDLSNASRTCKLWNRLAGRLSTMDIVLVCDISGSADYLKPLTRSVKKVLPTLVTNKVKLGFIGFNDHEDGDNPLTVTETGMARTVFKFMNGIKVNGGHDCQEAVLDGIDEALKFIWRRHTSKHILLFCDAPPHGSKFTESNELIKDDRFPLGCPCGLNENILLTNIKQRGIKFHFIDVSHMEDLRLTYQIFSKIINDMSYTKVRNGELLGDQFIAILNTIIQSKRKY